MGFLVSALYAFNDGSTVLDSECALPSPVCNCTHGKCGASTVQPFCSCVNCNEWAYPYSKFCAGKKIHAWCDYGDFSLSAGGRSNLFDLCNGRAASASNIFGIIIAWYDVDAGGHPPCELAFTKGKFVDLMTIIYTTGSIKRYISMNSQNHIGQSFFLAQYDAISGRKKESLSLRLVFT